MSADSLFSLQSCPTIVEALPRFIDGECGPTEEIRVAQHLERCSRCRRQHDHMVQEWKETMTAIHGGSTTETREWVQGLTAQLPTQDEAAEGTEEFATTAATPGPGSGRWASLAASVLLALFLFSGTDNTPAPSGTEPAPVALTLIRGDVDASGKLDWRDVQGLIDFLQEDGPEPRCIAAGDFDEDGEITIDDSVLALSHLTEGAGLDSTILYSQSVDSLPCFEHCP
jgi:hypothetical protein